MKAQEMVRKAITTAYCLDYDTYCEIFQLEQGPYAMLKWRKQQDNFGAWFCDLDTGNSRLFMDYVLREK